MYERQQLFDFMLNRIKDVKAMHSLEEPQAFARWFCEMYFLRPQDIYIPDGSKDGKVDLFLKTTDEESVTHHILNTKFTRKYNESAPVVFYDEITRFWKAFNNRAARKPYLQTVRDELRNRYRTLFERYDAGAARLMFVTNHRKNPWQYESVRNYDMDIFHLEDLIQFMADHIEDAMPKTPPLLLTGISTLLTPDRHDTEVPTSIVFARLIDLIKYMQKDPFGLLFSRNVRLWLGNKGVNKEIRETFETAPKEFVFSNNGITMLCEKHRHDPGSHELWIENPRVVNGSQTLHSIRDADNPNPNARVMVRVIEVPPLKPDEVSAQAQKRKDIIHKISTRSNRQNPIKKWNLVSNDDFQNSLARYFRAKKLFYERRQNEWNYRRTELKSVGVKRGPEIRWMGQLISSFNWDRKHVGPVKAHHQVGLLFEDDAYDIIKETSPELAYQIYRLSTLVDSAFWALSEDKQYIANMYGHAWLTVFALVVKAFQTANAGWGENRFTSFLESEWEGWNDHASDWKKLVLAAIEQLRTYYLKENVIHKRREGQPLPYNTYFKSQTSVSKVLKAPVSRDTFKCTRKVVVRAK